MSSPRRPGRFVLGFLIWASLVGGAVTLVSARSKDLGPPAERVLRYASSRPVRIDVTLEAVATDRGWIVPCAGDPVLAGDERICVGTIDSVRTDTAAVATPTFTVAIVVDPEYDARDLEGATFAFGSAGREAQWVFDTLLPPKKREQAWSELVAYTGSHSQEISELLRPIGDQVLEHAMRVLDENLVPTINRHEKDIDALLAKYDASLKEDLLPVLKDELGPSAKEKARPILTKIGRECWDALPMWQGGWAYVKGKIPGLGRDYVDEWWKDFLDNKAIPIVKEHEDELVKAGEDLVKEGLKNPKVRAAFRAEWKKLTADPAFKDLVRAIVEEALVRPFDPKALAKKIAEDPGNRARWKKLEETLDPVLEKIGRDVAITRRPDGRDGLSPELARVIRRIVFNKDARWVTVTPRRPLVPLSGRS